MSTEEKPVVKETPAYYDTLTASVVDMAPVEKMTTLEVQPFASNFSGVHDSHYSHFFQPIPTSNSATSDGYTLSCEYPSQVQTQFTYYDPQTVHLYPPQTAYPTEMYPSLPQQSPPKIENSPPPQDPRAKPPPKKRIQAVSCHSNSVCANCGTRETTLWRRNQTGEIECNACNLYFRKNGTKRPLSLKKDNIMKRNRKPRCDSPYRP